MLSDPDLLAIQVALARRSLLDYCTLIDQSYVRYRHVEALGEKLMRIDGGDLTRLMVFMPPQHGKSQTASGMFPGWFIGRNPTRRIILTSYAAQLAETFSIQNRDTIQYNPMWSLTFPSVTLSPSVRAVDKWAVLGQRESLIAAGVGGPITGFGAHLLIIDDPVKNYEEACSKANRDKQFLWYKTTARTRLRKRGAVVLIMTRWVEEDLAGAILNSEEGKDFEVLHLPAESLGTAEDYPNSEPPIEIRTSAAFPDPLGRPKGEPLCPEFGFDSQFLDKSRSVLLNDFNALYQGSPTAPGGDKFKRVDFLPCPDLTGLSLYKSARSWDLAWSESTAADYTVGLLGELWTSEDYWLVLLADLAREKVEDPSELIMETARTDGADVEVLIESVAAQSKEFRSVKRDQRMWNRVVRPVYPNKDKLIRAQPAMRLSGKGRVFLRPAPWNAEFLTELAVFPNGKHDDQVDVLSQLITYWLPILDTLVWKKVAPVPPKPVWVPWEFRTSGPVMQDQTAWQIGERAWIRN